MKIAEMIINEAASQQPASNSDRSKFQQLSKKLDSLEDAKKKLLDQLSKEADDKKRAQVQTKLHATREQIEKTSEARKVMMRKYRGLRSKK